ncbi:MAG: molybdopterin-dependent oxidoreductase [Armatimonadota bacterium]|nr:molybdopterin-dependent oxidoreductase [Armatimonadota bacterium]
MQLQLALDRLGWSGQSAGTPDYSLHELRQRKLPWDRVVKGTHITNCWYQYFCSVNLYVRDGVVLREEQAGNYPPRTDGTPDFNPRGCQKGLCYPERLYDASRLKYPLKRVGQRGEGRWQRISWDQALDEIAEVLLETLVTEGPEVIHEARGTMGFLGSSQLAAVSLLDVLGVPRMDVNTDLGDDHQGAALTFGKAVFSDSADNWFHADVILIWGGNPAYTHIPNYHFIAEARYRGAQVVAIGPDYSASAIHADLWVPVNIGTDAALALGMAQVILEEGLYRADFVREQTDLPLLVREDSGRFLREADLKRGGRDDVLYLWDEARGLTEAPRKSLELHGLKPALEGAFTVDTLAGKVAVKPVFQRLKELLDRDYTPRQAGAICGVRPELIRRLARGVARARGVVNISTSNFSKFYHGDLIERAIILVFALCGHLGRRGASYNAFPMLTLDTAFGATERRGEHLLLGAAAADPRYAQWRLDGYTDEMVLYEYIRDAFARGKLRSSALTYLVHGGLLELSEQHNSWDPYLKRPVGDYLRESLANGWHGVSPPSDRTPKVVIAQGGNILRRVRASEQFLRSFLPKVRLLVTLDWRMSTTALYSDYVLPIATWYETDSLPWRASPISPFVVSNRKAVEPLYEARNEWETYFLIARKLQEKALARGITSYRDAQGQERRLDRLEKELSRDGLYLAEDEEAIARDVFLNATNVEQADWDEFREKGVLDYTGVGRDSRSIGNACDIQPGEPIVPLTWHTERKEPYPTLTRRIQFYIDHPWYLELGEALPVHKDPPRAGGDYPLCVTGGHARWSIHTCWTDQAVLLRLQRGEPILFMSREDALARGIEDGDRVEVFNDVAAFQVQAAVSPAVRPGQTIIYHAWENYQFPAWKHFQSVMPSPLNPIELAGGYFQLRPLVLTLTPGLSDRDTRVEVRRGPG